MKFIDWFAGVGGFRIGMELAGHECVGFCEYDKFAVMSYKMMHLVTEEQREYIMSLDFKTRQKEISKEEYLNGEWYSNDVRSVDAGSVPRADCWCFGFPCQDISVAGKQLGFDGKRSSLFFTVTRLIRDTEEENRPSTLFIENVKNLLSINGGIDFLKLLIELDEIGYDAEWQVLNSKDFGVPQNRERVFVIGHLRGRSRREVFPITSSHREIDNIQRPYTGTITARTGINNTVGSYILHEDKQYAQSVNIIGNVNPSGNGMNGQVYSSSGLAPTLTTNKGEGNKVAIPVLTPDRLEKRQNGRRFKEDGEEMFTLTAQDRHGVMVREATKKGYVIAEIGDSINLEQPNSETRRERVGKGVAQTLTTSCNQAVLRPVRTEYGKQIRKDYEAGNVNISRHEFLNLEPRTDGISNTLSTVQKDNLLKDGLRIRKLTPKECFRLQGWTDEYFERAASVNSDSQLYKQAGNGVTVNVIHEIAKKL